MRKKNSGYTFLDMTKEVMEIEKKPLTVAQIWKYGEINNLTDKIVYSRKHLSDLLNFISEI